MSCSCAGGVSFSTGSPLVEGSERRLTLRVTVAVWAIAQLPRHTRAANKRNFFMIVLRTIRMVFRCLAEKGCGAKCRELHAATQDKFHFTHCAAAGRSRIQRCEFQFGKTRSFGLAALRNPS